MLNRIDIPSLLAVTAAASLLACRTGAPTPASSVPDPDAPAPMAAPALTVTPVSHASFVLRGGEVVLYNDPVGGAEAWASFPPATHVLVSDIHGDHLDSVTLEAVVRPTTALIVPRAVADRLSPKLAARATVLANGDSVVVAGLPVRAVPMYNLREEALRFHPPGRGNGYVVEVGNERVYVAGDTEDIPEMRALRDIDRAFVPMNLPYTMPASAAADAVLAFRPSLVYPYHFRGRPDFGDTAAFRAIVAGGGETQVVGPDWYGRD